MVFYIFILFFILIVLGVREEDGFCVLMLVNYLVGFWLIFNCIMLSLFICEFYRVGFIILFIVFFIIILLKLCEIGWLELDGNCYKVCVKLFNFIEFIFYFNIECVYLILKKN